MDFRDFTLLEVIEIFKMFGLCFDITLEEALKQLEDDFEYYDNARDVYDMVLKDRLDKDELITILEDAVEYSYIWDDIIDDYLGDYDIIEWEDRYYIRHIG